LSLPLKKKTAKSGEHFIINRDCGFRRNDTGALADCDGAMCLRKTQMTPRLLLFAFV
jgi:hypothetical protein